ncbi:unnamed protein product [Hyaloperonospora brassicae]|uniref:Uncharacterized protein n=1 Tax=Hyaloperonospora brassicae TaxID=162125 RepID=A0AAV0U2E9_HYABA|nr:unnamed protein product [Hyaloperonospora brassicae]
MHALSAAASDGHRAVAGAPLAPLRQDDSINAIPSQAQAQPAAQDTARDEQQRRRVQQAETILLEIAKEFAAKRAAGLVPMKPVPARTLLWQELERRAQRVRSRVGRRGTCVFGRDTDSGPCGCSTYKTGNTGLDPGGGVCACCSHGAPWHRLSGGTMAATDSGSTTLSHSSRATARVSLRPRKGTGRSRASSRNSCYAAASRSASGEALQQTLVEGSVYSLGSDYYDEFDGEYSDEESEEEDDDDDVANEVARPHGMMMEDLAPPLVHSHARSEGDTSLDRSSLFSNGDSFGLPPRLSSTSRHLDKLLGAIAKYRTMGLSEAEIEVKLRRDFPPTERLSHDGKRSSSSLSSPSSSPSRPTRASQ